MYRTLSILFLSISFSFGQDYFIVNDGVKTEDYQYNVFTNANIYSGGGIIKNATLIEKEGKIFDIGEKIVKKVPIVNIIYSTLKQITETFTKGSPKEFKGAVYIQYPREGVWTLAFISGESKSEDETIFYHLFVPTTPNPTSGFFLMIPQKDAINSKMSVEEGLKTIISGGLLAPKENPLK